MSGRQLFGRTRVAQPRAGTVVLDPAQSLPLRSRIVPCPRCGSRSPRALVAPGHWRCEAVEAVPGDSFVVPPHGSGNASAAARPVDVPLSYRSCGTVYEVAARELTAGERAEEDAFEEAARAREDRVREWQREVAAQLDAISDPGMQVLAIMKVAGCLGLVRSGLFTHEQLADLGRRPPWDHDAVQRSFLSSVRTPPRPQSVVGNRGRGLRLKARRPMQPGWRFADGSTMVDWIGGSGPHGGTPERQVVQAITVLEDGRRLYGMGLPARPGEGFNARAIEAMAGMCDVPRLPAAPPLSHRDNEQWRLAEGRAPTTTDALRDILRSRSLRTQRF